MSDKLYTPSNPNAQQGVRNVLKYLSDITYEKIITGQHTQTMAQEELHLIEKVTGKQPALLGFELLSYSPNINYSDTDDECMTEVTENYGTLKRAWEWAEKKDTAKWQEQIHRWGKENPLAMRRDRGISPQMIMEHINAQFPHSIYVTDVGQHQMWATQYLELDEQSQLITSGGLGTMGFGFPAAIGAKIANPKKPVVCITGDGGFQMNIQEMATAVTQGTGITICLLNNNYLGMVRQMQELFYGKRYSATCLRRRPSCPGGCKGPNDQCPEYVPDFVKLAESYGAYGIRVEKEEDIDAAFAEAKKHTDAPTIIEFMIATDELVLPMVKSGNPMSEMILK